MIGGEWFGAAEYDIRPFESRVAHAPPQQRRLNTTAAAFDEIASSISSDRLLE